MTSRARAVAFLAPALRVGIERCAGEIAFLGPGMRLARKRVSPEAPAVNGKIHKWRSLATNAQCVDKGRRPRGNEHSEGELTQSKELPPWAIDLRNPCRNKRRKNSRRPTNRTARNRRLSRRNRLRRPRRPLPRRSESHGDRECSRSATVTTSALPQTRRLRLSTTP